MTRTVQVQTPYGLVSGQWEATDPHPGSSPHDGVYAYRSVAYADLPSVVDDPVPLQPAVDPSVTAPRAHGGDPHAFVVTPPHAKYGDDLPVLVWAAAAGLGPNRTGRLIADLARAFARQGVVSVVVHHRGTVPGWWPFFDDEPHHYRATEDLQLGLEWVQKSIEGFGGDPTNVTLAGHGASGAAALWLARKDHYRGAFRRLVVLSPTMSHTSAAKLKGSLRWTLNSPITRKHLRRLAHNRPDALRRRSDRFRRRHPLLVARGPYDFDPTALANVPMLVSYLPDEAAGDRLSAFSRIKAAWLSRLLVRLLGKRAALAVPARSYLQRLDQDYGGSTGAPTAIQRLVADSMVYSWVNKVLEESRHPRWLLRLHSSARILQHGDEMNVQFGPGLTSTVVAEFIHGRQPQWPAYVPGTSRVALDIDLHTGESAVIDDPLHTTRVCFGTQPRTGVALGGGEPEDWEN